MSSPSSNLLLRVFVRFGLAIPVLMALFFIPAGTWNYWQAWVYLAVLFIPMIYALWYLYTYMPDLLERRIRMKEQEPAQKRLIGISAIIFMLFYALPGLDQRFGWSIVPAWLVLLANGFVLTGYISIFLVFRENRYASRVVEVAEGQEVISSGPYSVVRHPMYSGALLMYLFSPLALGSYWAVLPAISIFFIIIPRLLNEEEVLTRDLPGYAEYMGKVKYRLLPGIW